MTGAAYYPKADRNVQNFSSRFGGSHTNPNVLVLHTTETGTWPSYSGGAVAPNLTFKPDVASKRLLSRQHFPVNMSSRALVNSAGGVETNTLNAVQVELIGTCSKAYRDKYGYFYWPDAPDWALQELADFVTWLNAEWPAFPIKDAAVRGWKPYPSSYGNTSGQRLSYGEWSNAYGIVGHQHVPENVHGDPGDFKAGRLAEFAHPAVRNPDPSGSTSDPRPPTLVQKARAGLRAARLRAQDNGWDHRVEKINAALKELPKR